MIPIFAKFVAVWQKETSECLTWNLYLCATPLHEHTCDIDVLQ